jgi:broad specificity phosphatase PhoE
MEIFLIRHGETLENRNRIIQGSLPGHLSGNGKQQCKSLALKLLEHAPFDQIISSDLERARETADIISKEIPPCPIILEKKLRERNYGSLEGQSLFSLKRLLVETKKDVTELEIPGGESYRDFELRIMDFFLKLVKDGINLKIVLVTHAGVIRIVQEKILCLPVYKIENCDGFKILLTANDEIKVHTL